MRLSETLAHGTLVSRYKARFFADVCLDDGREVTAHCPNPGAMLGLNTPGLVAWVVAGRDGAKRKLAWTLELVEADGGLVGINTLHPNRLVAEGSRGRRDPGAGGIRRSTAAKVKMERGEPRIGFRAPGSADRPACWLEVKNCHLRRAGTLAGVSRLRRRPLSQAPARRTRGDGEALGDRAVRCCSWSSAPDCGPVLGDVGGDLDPAFAHGLDRAAETGVEVLIYALARRSGEWSDDRAAPLPWLREGVPREAGRVLGQEGRRALSARRLHRYPPARMPDSQSSRTMTRP